MGKIAAIFRFQQARRDAAYSRRKNYDVVSLFGKFNEFKGFVVVVFDVSLLRVYKQCVQIFSLGMLIAIRRQNRLVALVIHRFELKST